MATTSAGLSPAQALLLGALNKAAVDLTREELADEAGVPATTDNLGPVYEEALENHPDSLYAKGLVRPIKTADEPVVRWKITPKGRQLARTIKGRKTGATIKVPNDELDPVVVEFRKTRTYGLEKYLEDDWSELRDKLSEKWHEVELEDLKHQVLARRKTGAYADPDDKLKKSVRRMIREFGPKGEVKADFLTEDQLMELYEIVGGGDE